jgi:hypothetical protein
MSWQATSWAKEQRTGSPSLKATLLCLADYADPETHSCFPSQSVLASHVEISVRTLRTNLGTLEEMGLIARRHRESRTGRQTDAYTLKIDAQSPAADLADGGSAEGEPTGKAHRQTVAAQESTLEEDSPQVFARRVQPKPETVVRSPSTEHLKQKPVESPRARVVEGLELTGTAERRQRSKPRTGIPSTWNPDPAGVAYAEKAGMNRLIIDREAGKFRNHHMAKGSLMADWNAAWRTWCDKAIEFSTGPRYSAAPLNGSRPRQEPRPGDVDYRDPGFQQYVP